MWMVSLGGFWTVFCHSECLHAICPQEEDYGDYGETKSKLILAQE